jgi:hypothetical protein
MGPLRERLAGKRVGVLLCGTRTDLPIPPPSRAISRPPRRRRLMSEVAPLIAPASVAVIGASEDQSKSAARPSAD